MQPEALQRHSSGWARVFCFFVFFLFFFPKTFVGFREICSFPSSFPFCTLQQLPFDESTSTKIHFRCWPLFQHPRFCSKVLFKKYAFDKTVLLALPLLHVSCSSKSCFEKLLFFWSSLPPLLLLLRYAISLLFFPFTSISSWDSSSDCVLLTHLSSFFFFFFFFFFLAFFYFVSHVKT